MTDPTSDSFDRFLTEFSGLDPEEQTDRLALLAAADPDFHRAVTAWIAGDSSGETFRVAPQEATGFPVGETMDDVRIGPGMQIGPCVLTRLLGEGGMGAVYEARQEGLDRPVAIKFMKSGLVAREARARFLHEAKLLSRLRHPGIAQVHEVGLHDLGAGQVSLPYYILELVPDAQPLSRFVRKRKLDDRAIVELFIAVADAVLHGHRLGVIHRDLKPANILVDPEGRPKVIDFGLARVESDDLDTRSFATETGMIVGTLPYMSPEQLNGSENIDTRSDIYALGVILYELLTGERPFEFRGKSLPQAVAEVRETAPPLLSVLRPDISKDLETICLKTLRKDADERYPSVDALTDDLDRWLQGMPVHARPQTAGYQLRLFARRNKALVAAMAAFVILLIVATLVAVKLAEEARAAEVRALSSARAEKLKREQTERLLGVSTTLSNWLVLEHLDRLVVMRDGTRLAEETANHILSWLDGMQAAADRDPGLERSLALATLEVGSVLGAPMRPNLGRTGLAYERVKAAEASFADLFRRNPGDVDRTVDLVVARVTRAELENMLGRPEEARALLDASLELVRGLELGADERARIAQLEAQVVGDIGMLLGQQGQPADGLALIREALKLRSAHPTDADVGRVDVERSILRDRLRELDLLGQLDRVEEIGALAPPLIERLRVLAQSDDPVAINDLSAALASLGDALLHDPARLAEAEATYREARDLRVRVLERDPEDAFRQQALAVAEEHLAISIMMRGEDFPEALRSLRTAESILRRAADQAPESPELRGNLGIVLGYIVDVAGALNDNEAAQRAGQEALAIARKNAAEQPGDLHATRVLAEALTGMGHIEIRGDEREMTLEEQVDSIRRARKLYAEALELYRGLETRTARPAWLDANIKAQERYLAICDEAIQNLQSLEPDQ